MNKFPTSIICLGIAVFGLAACGDGGGSSGNTLSGRYIAELEMEGESLTMEFNFLDDKHATFSMAETGSPHEAVDCTYDSGETLISMNCFGSSGMSLTRTSDGSLEADMGGMLVRYQKR